MGLAMKEAPNKVEQASSAEVNSFFKRHKSKYKEPVN